MQSIGNVLFDPRWEVLNVCVGKPGVFEFADVEAELFDHRLEASDSEPHIGVLENDLIVTVVAEKEI